MGSAQKSLGHSATYVTFLPRSIRPTISTYSPKATKVVVGRGLAVPTSLKNKLPQDFKDPMLCAYKAIDDFWSPEEMESRKARRRTKKRQLPIFSMQG